MARICIIIFFFISFNCANGQPARPPKLRVIASGLTAPVDLATAHDNSGRIFVCEQTGRIRVIRNGVLSPKPFLDISPKLDRIGKAYSEKGLLGLAFHPSFKTNGRFFVYYSAPTSTKGMEHKSVIAEYHAVPGHDAADPGSERVLLEIEQPESNHNGGQLVFGPDGFLYIGSGDGGGAGDEHGQKGNAQDLSTLLGKILRIDVEGKPYSVPPSNPFVKKPGAKPEIWAFGLRNPWRFSFDKQGRLFCADVGQNKWEEIDIVEKGGNYGWRLMEGNHCFNPKENCPQGGLKMPIAEYGHNEGISITGGFVYRGPSIPLIQGRYVFGDWKGKLFYLEEKSAWKRMPLTVEGKKSNDAGMNINSFGQDDEGKLYMLCQKFTGTFLANGVVYVFE